MQIGHGNGYLGDIIDKDQKFSHQKVIKTFLMKMPIFYQISIGDNKQEFTTVQQLATAVSK
uniref:Uncharacterized protein n=1 Tax=Romanomermis culicivorax TaxID=13658 RepID=A0A915IZE6_ROMCU